MQDGLKRAHVRDPALREVPGAATLAACGLGGLAQQRIHVGRQSGRLSKDHVAAGARPEQHLHARLGHELGREQAQIIRVGLFEHAAHNVRLSRLARARLSRQQHQRLNLGKLLLEELSRAVACLALLERTRDHRRHFGQAAAQQPRRLAQRFPVSCGYPPEVG